MLARLINDESGAAASEYAIAVAFVAIAAAAAASQFFKLNEVFIALTGLLKSLIQ